MALPSGEPCLDRLKNGASAIQQGMPSWKYLANRFLSWVENWAFRLKLSDFHTGYRAFSREVLETDNFRMNSDGFIFDQEIVAPAVAERFRIGKIAVPVRYFPEASSAGFVNSCLYGVKIFGVVTRYLVHRMGLKRSRRLQSFRDRYTRFPSSARGEPGTQSLPRRQGNG
jgi:hypothetical protein